MQGDKKNKIEQAKVRWKYLKIDMKTIKFFNNNKDISFVVPLGVGSHIESWGVTNDRIIESDWWQDYEFNNIKFTATPAQHFSGRGLFDRNRTLWASWVIKSENSAVVYSCGSMWQPVVSTSQLMPHAHLTKLLTPLPQPHDL